MRILILNDQPGRADALASCLQAAGHSAMGFTCPAEVLAALQENDILVMDYQRPEMTGLEVARQASVQGWRGSLLLMSGRSAAMGQAKEHLLLHFILDKSFSTQSGRQI